MKVAAKLARSHWKADMWGWTGDSCTTGSQTSVWFDSATSDSSAFDATWTLNGKVVWVPSAPPSKSVNLNVRSTRVQTPADRPQNFNQFINASDLVAEFLKYAQEEVPGLQRGVALELPVQHFIRWLVIRAAEADGVAAPEGVEKPIVPRHRINCRGCGKFLKREFRREIQICSEICFRKAVTKMTALVPIVKGA